MNHKIQSIIISNEPYSQENPINKDFYLRLSKNYSSNIYEKRKKFCINNCMKPSICMGFNIQGSESIDKSYFMFDVPIIEIFFDDFLFNYENVTKFEESFQYYKQHFESKLKEEYDKTKKEFEMIKKENFDNVKFEVVLSHYGLMRISFSLNEKIFNLFVKQNETGDRKENLITERTEESVKVNYDLRETLTVSTQEYINILIKQNKKK